MANFKPFLKGELQYNEVPAGSMKLDSWVEDRDAGKCPQKGREVAGIFPFCQSVMLVGQFVSTWDKPGSCFSARAEQKGENQGDCRGLVLAAKGRVLR